ncbi:TetR family transcriptional regulator [Acetobacter nitrogenifigens DSM 23921 = NBRC 105050]|uniref:TetR family transcriptional regulator n=2 Tax=Acetobacter nitrogenifigens TaxID=285268 RepID=A0A511XAT8_9PROT|nr:hypothetical protein [Acetobacter nitrogenifigens]GBQ90986.1 TetR family transcriptional regulator [Acetobacter nitrogenifigens DSM 23921 = NBRC 105050]GEN60035.1 hypothetical protein ANI02nite_19190 [Acetobacter nitrogenifigens DSM 23921 = NBRC 105050]
MENDHFDSALLAAAMSLAASQGWRNFTLTDVARHADFDMGDVRARFPFKSSMLLLLGTLADRSSLVDDGSVASPREALFDRLMRRFDVFQQYREGVLAVLHALPYDPALATLLGGATLNSMRWISDASGVNTRGLEGLVRIHGVTAVWAYTLRAWEKDDSEDLGGTMAALELALDRAERLGLFRGATGKDVQPTEADLTSDASGHTEPGGWADDEH